MDYSQYVKNDFDSISAFNMRYGVKDTCYKQHWHSYGEIILVAPGENNIFKVNQDTYHLAAGDFVLVWPREMHEVVDANLEDTLIIQFSNAFVNSLFDLQRIMHFYRNTYSLVTN